MLLNNQNKKIERNKIILKMQTCIDLILKIIKSEAEKKMTKS